MGWRIKNKDNMNIIISTIIIFFLMVLNLFDNNHMLSKTLIIGGFIPIIIYMLYNSKEFIPKIRIINSDFRIVIFLWTAFVGTMILSELQNSQLSESIMYTLLPIVIIAYNLKLKDILISFAISLFPFVFAAFVASLIGNKFTSNTIGILVSAYIIISLSLLLLIKYNVKYKVLTILSILPALYSIVKINSRTAQLVVFTAFFIIITGSVIQFVKNIINKEVISKKTATLIVVVIAAIIIILSKDVFLSIIAPKWNPNDISTGRFGIWETTIKNANLFGHSYTWYVDSNLFGTHKGPHNILIGVLAYQGIVGVIIFTIFVLSLYHFVIKNRKTNNLELKISTFLFMLTLVKGISEGMIYNSFYSAYNIIFIISITYIMKSQLSFEYPDIVVKKKHIITNAVPIIFFIISLMFTIYATVLNFNLSFIIDILNRYI